MSALSCSCATPMTLVDFNVGHNSLMGPINRIHVASFMEGKVGCLDARFEPILGRF